MAIHDILLTVSLVTQLQAGNPVGTASGFFYEDGDRLFFVTNVHVVKGDEVAPDTLRLRLHTDAKDASKNENYDIALYDSGNAPAWKTDPASPDADVAVLKLDRKQITSKFVIRTWSKQDFLPSRYAMLPGEDIFSIGYPLGVADYQNNLPVLKGGMVASAYGIPFQGGPLFLTDIQLHPGISGSPVVAKPKAVWVNQEDGGTEITPVRYYLLGVHSGSLDVKNPKNGLRIGLGAAWYVSIVQNIAEQFK